jgi:hypothetical protein
MGKVDHLTNDHVGRRGSAPSPAENGGQDFVANIVGGATAGAMRSEAPPPALTALFAMARPPRIAISLGVTIAQRRLDLGKTMPAADQPLYTAGGTSATAWCSPRLTA